MLKRILSMTLAAMLALAVFLPAAFAEESADGNIYYVYTDNGKDVNVYSAPNGEIVGTLKYGEKVEITSFINDYWVLITFHYDAGAGAGDWPAYVNRRFLIKVEPEQLEKYLEEEKEAYTGDPLMDITEEFKNAKTVEPYKVTMRPARVTSWVNMRWIPSETGMIIAQYKATEQLIVLKELDHYLQVQDPDTGDVGYIHRKFAADEQ